MSNVIGSKTLQSLALFNVKRNPGRLQLLRTNLGINVVYLFKNQFFGTPRLWNIDFCLYFDASKQPRVLYYFDLSWRPYIFHIY